MAPRAHVVARVLRVAREAWRSTAERSMTVPTFGAPRHRRADRERRVGAQVVSGDDEARRAGRLDVDPRAVRPAVDDVVVIPTTVPSTGA